MAETPYVYQPYPRWLYAPDGTAVLVQSAAEEAQYPGYARSPAGPWPEPEPAPAPEEAPVPPPKPAPHRR